MVPASDSTGAYVHFYIPLIIKAGCVELAIVSAGGPHISCVGEGVAKRRLRLEGRELEERQTQLMAPEYLPPTEDQIQVLQTVYANVTATGEPYEPMDWSGMSNSSSMEVYSSIMSG